MSLVSDTQDLLEELSYPWLQSLPLESLSLVDLSRALNWISQQLHFFSNTDSIVNIIQGDNEKDCLRIELNSLLKEVDSIYSDSFSLETANDRLAVLHSLIGNIFAARINYIRRIDSSSEFTQELNPRKDLTVINSCLSISDDLKDIKLYFQKVKEKLDKHLSKFHEEDSLLLPDGKSLSQEQWSQLKKLNEMLRNEYSIRREMMLRRVDMTVNSFSWKEDTSRDIDAQLIKNIYSKARNRLSFSPNITLSHALAARSSDCNVLINDVISTNHVNCMIEVPTFGQANQGAQQRLQLHKYLIGSVPDRGGRPNEQSAPARETFSQQKQQRESFGNRGRGRGNHGGGYHRGGGHQGGGGYQGRGGYQGGGGGHQGGHRNYNQNQQRYIPEQSNRVQNAGWQQSAGGYHNNYHNNQREANQFYHQEENYDQYQSGHQRFSGGYQTDNRQDNRSRGRGNYRSNRY